MMPDKPPPAPWSDAEAGEVAGAEEEDGAACSLAGAGAGPPLCSAPGPGAGLPSCFLQTGHVPCSSSQGTMQPVWKQCPHSSSRTSSPSVKS